MGKRVLGNDPFLRGAAAREPAPPTGDGAKALPDESRERREAAPPAPRSTSPATAEAGPAADLPLPPPKKLARESARAPGPKARPANVPAADAGTGMAAKPKARPARTLATDADGVGGAGTADAGGTPPGPGARASRPPARKTLPRSPFDAAPADATAPNRTVEATDLAADAGLLPADLAAATPAPRVVAVAPLPGKPLTLPPASALAPATAAEAARGLVALLRRLARVDATPSLEIDEFGRDPALAARVGPLLGWMYRRWFRVEEHGLEKLPRGGPVILVANRAGAIPWDAAMIGVAARRAGREVRPLLEDAVFHFPFLGVLVNRLGAVRACPENAERLLRGGGAVAVFPEGAGGFAKPFRERYRVQRFGRGGFVRLALRTRATIVPVAVVGSEETYPLLGRVPARFLGVPFVPITPTWPWLGPAGLWPLPSKWTIEFGEPVDLSSHGPDDAADDARVMRIAESVRTTVQAMLDARLAERTAVYVDRR